MSHNFALRSKLVTATKYTLKRYTNTGTCNSKYGECQKSDDISLMQTHWRWSLQICGAALGIISTDSASRSLQYLWGSHHYCRRFSPCCSFNLEILSFNLQSCQAHSKSEFRKLQQGSALLWSFQNGILCTFKTNSCNGS